MAALYVAAFITYMASIPPLSLGSCIGTKCPAAVDFVYTFLIYLVFPFSTFAIFLLESLDKIVGGALTENPDPLLYYFLTAASGITIFYLLGLLVDKLETKLSPPKKKRTSKASNWKTSEIWYTQALCHK